jgi:hypothetical protein
MIDEQTGISAWQVGGLVAGRFRLIAPLGQGGAGRAFRACDERTGRELALKVLALPQNPKHAQLATEYFEREFHSLKHLAHPRIVQVYDYGVWAGEPFYSLELLDGGDLSELAPLPWQRVCRVAYDVCSALSLLHSRRLLHRDISPRNVRCTSTGKAKLFDFGLLSPIGVASELAGTPPCVAPELLNRAALDGRSDLFSLGATLYFALTGRYCFPARRFDELQDLWRSIPAPPSAFVPDVPQALDELILSLIRIDSGSRPQSAAEVMDRLVALPGVAVDEELESARSYLVTPQLFGRDAVVLSFRKQLMRTLRGQGGGFLVVAEPGLGRSRMLDAFVLEAKLIGAIALRVNARTSGAAPFAAVSVLARELLMAQPDSALRLLQEQPATYASVFRTRAAPDQEATELELEPFDTASDPASLHAALQRWFMRTSTARPLAVVVDDFEQLDDASAGFLAELTWDAPQHRCAYAFSARAHAANGGSQALVVLGDLATCVELGPLTRAEIHSLLASLFGEVPNLQQLSSRLHDSSGGRPRDCMALAQHLIDIGAITYTHGIWHLPSELPAGLLPATMEEELERRIASLALQSRRICVLLAECIVGHIRRAELLSLAGLTAELLDAALDELRVARLVTENPAGYALCDPSVAHVLRASIGAADLRAHHLDLAGLFLQAESSPIAVAFHLVRAGEPVRAIEHLQPILSDPAARIAAIDRSEVQLGTERTADSLLLALRAAEELGRPLAELQVLRAMLAGMAARGADAQLYYHDIAATWLEQLKHDSGYYDWQTLAAETDPLQRAKLAVGRALQRYGASDKRAMEPTLAIKQLIGYVVMSIAVSVRTNDLALQRTLPELLDATAPLSPMAEAMRRNALATRLNGEGKREQARHMFGEVLAVLAQLGGADLVYVDKIRAAIAQTMAEIDASLGLAPSYGERISLLPQDPNQLAAAHYVRKVVALHRGDGEAAERHRRDAELAGLQSRVASMFSTLGQELEAHALARDLTGVKQVKAAISRMAHKSRGWQPVLGVAEAHYLHLCGDLPGALRIAAAVSDEAESASPWCIQARALATELLVELERPEQALAICTPALELCERLDMPYLARSLSCALALAEAALGRFDEARVRVQRVIEDLNKLCVTGLLLGRAYECEARVAIAQRDDAQFALAAERVAEQYHCRTHRLLGASYERLMDDARRAGLGVCEDATADSLRTHIREALARCHGPAERAYGALELLCAGQPPTCGYLFLTTRSGLERVAQTAGLNAPGELTRFAELCFEAETQDALVTMTAADLTALAGNDNGTGASQWKAANGDSYRAMPLRVHGRLGWLVLGVALLNESVGCAAPELDRLVAVLTEELIGSGDFVATRAA